MHGGGDESPRVHRCGSATPLIICSPPVLCGWGTKESPSGFDNVGAPVLRQSRCATVIGRDEQLVKFFSLGGIVPEISLGVPRENVRQYCRRGRWREGVMRRRRARREL